MLRIRKLTVRYGPLAALKEISLEVKRGEVVALIGPNRAGKTTLLRTISGIVETTEGRILFEEEDITNLSPHKIVSRGVGHVPQGRHIFPTLSVFDNLMMGAYPKRKATEEIGGDLGWVYELFPILKERKDQRAGTLSGGEQQMLAIGMALIVRPTLLLLDEPLLGLSPVMQKALVDAISSLKKESGITVVLSEQFARPVLPLIDRGYVVENGMLALHGTGAELMDNPEIKSAYFGV